MSANRALVRACSLLVGWFALMSAVACSSAISTISTVEVESAQTAARVMTALVNDPEIGTRPITVQVTRGVVRLSGRVNSQAEVDRAIALARAVPGVSRVDANIRVGAETPTIKAPPAEARLVARDPAIEFAELEPAPGRLAIGGSIGISQPATASFESAWSVSPLVRFGFRPGLGAVAIFDWYGASVTAGPGLPASRLRVRPIMAGLGYTVGAGRVSVSPSLAGGFAFNRIILPDTGAVNGLPVDAGNSLAWRPGVSMWLTTSPRTVASLSVGRVFTSVNMTFIEAGVLEQRTVKADATTVSIGLAYRLF